MKKFHIECTTNPQLNKKLTSGVAASDIHQILDIHQTLTDLFPEEAKQLFYLETEEEEQ